MRCPACQQPNQPTAPFCVECGESLALGNAADGGAASEGHLASIANDLTSLRVTQSESFFPAFNLRRHRFGISLAIMTLLIALLLNAMAQRSRDNATQYHQGLEATQQQQWHRAAALLGPLATQGYDQARDHYNNAVSQAASWDYYYSLAATAEQAGATTQAAFYYQRANQLEPGYGDAAAKLTNLRPDVGQVIYRQPDGLYLAPADGEPGTRLPGSGSDFEVLATSPDGNLVCYVFNSGYGTVRTRNLVVGDIANQFYAEQSFIFDHPVPTQPLDAAFVNEGQGLLFVVGGKIGEPASPPLELYYLDLAGVNGLNNLGLAREIASPAPTDSALYFVPAIDSRVIFSYDLTSRLTRRISVQRSAIANLALSASPSYNAGQPTLFYALVDPGYVHFYAMQPRDGIAQPLQTVPLLANTTPVEVRISPAPHRAQAIAAIIGQPGAWLLDGANQRAVLLGKDWADTLGPVGDVQYSPDGSRILVVGQPTGSVQPAPYGILDSQGTLLRSSYYDTPASQIGWLADSRHFYVYAHDSSPASAPSSEICRISAQPCSRDHVAVLDSDGGTNYIFTLGSPVGRDPDSLFGLMPDSKTLIYVAPYGANLAVLAEQLSTPTLPATAIPTATGVWVLR
jgi:tetratricopeptide (TPR) repeat protein